MMRWCAPALGSVLLAACSDPLAGIEDVSDVTFAEGPAVSVVRTDDEINRKQGVLSRLWQQPDDVNHANVAPEPALETTASVELPKPPAVDEAQAVQIQPALSEEPTEVLAAPVVVPQAEVALAPKPKPASGRLISWLASQASKADSNAETPKLIADPEKVNVLTSGVNEAALDADTQADDVQLASLSVEPEVEAPKRNTQTRRVRKPIRTKANSPDVPYGTVLPFGEVGRVCEARSQPLGAKIETSDGRGQTYRLYDSVPGSTSPRTFYVTGFADKCPRQFTAALALFGAPELHEQLRYGRAATTYPYSATDKAYEKIKSQVCGVGPRIPCGPKIEKLARDTVFISTYERFTDNGRWADLLVHDGAVVAASLKAPGQRTQ